MHRYEGRIKLFTLPPLWGRVGVGGERQLTFPPPSWPSHIKGEGIEILGRMTRRRANRVLFGGFARRHPWNARICADYNRAVADDYFCQTDGASSPGAAGTVSTNPTDHPIAFETPGSSRPARHSVGGAKPTNRRPGSPNGPCAHGRVLAFLEANSTVAIGLNVRPSNCGCSARGTRRSCIFTRPFPTRPVCSAGRRCSPGARPRRPRRRLRRGRWGSCASGRTPPS